MKKRSTPAVMPPTAASGEIPDLRRVVSIQAAVTFNRFLESVVRAGNRVADIVEDTGAANQSSVMKQLTGLNNRFRAATGSDLFWKSEKGQWYSTPLGDKLYNVTFAIEQQFRPIERWIGAQAGFSQLRIAMNAFSFHSFVVIEREMSRIKPTMKFNKHFVYFRSADVFENIKKRHDLDVGITESFNSNIENDSQLDVVEIDGERVSLLANFDISSDFLDDSGMVHKYKLRELPLIMGDTKSFLEYLVTIIEGQKVSESMAANDIFAYVQNTYDIQETSQSIQTLMDMLLLETKNLSMLATPEVKSHVLALSGNASSYAGKELPTRNIYVYNIDDGGIPLRKFALRRRVEGDPVQKEVTDLFWKAAMRLSGMRHRQDPVRLKRTF
ncbi:hypothetical protein [Hyphomonas sp.]|uniref:hypothetical protein n=1 Tax=Alphaproteobacteria TaxID=28211 RepID=UPI003263FA9B